MYKARFKRKSVIKRWDAGKGRRETKGGRLRPKQGNLALGCPLLIQSEPVGDGGSSRGIRRWGLPLEGAESVFVATDTGWQGSPA